jgi:hypothetical protein
MLNSHYCSNTLLSIGQKRYSKSTKVSRHKKYNLLASNQMNEETDNCLLVKLVRDKKDSKVSIIIGNVNALLDL